MIKITIDGSYHPTHRISAGAMIIHGAHAQKQTYALSASDNHSAEFQILQQALSYCQDNKWEDELIFIYSDSKTVVDAVSKKYTKQSAYLPILTSILNQLTNFTQVSIQWIPEQENKEADHYARRALQKELKSLA